MLLEITYINENAGLGVDVRLPVLARHVPVEFLPVLVPAPTINKDKQMLRQEHGSVTSPFLLGGKQGRNWEGCAGGARPLPHFTLWLKTCL